ncbi:hypothetical protein [Streptococcus caballi]|uniref:hypothetical protein n=1 Tax=Streptococcus caballi TaxID=439220 RepID=UPI0003A26B68
MIDIKILHLSAIDILVTAKIEVDTLCIKYSVQLINQIEADIREKIPVYKIYIYIETDLYREN